MVAFADGIESAQKQWREKASRVDDQITWWEPTERTFVPFDYPHTQTDEEMGAAAIEQARAMVRIERRRDEGWARAEGDDDFWLGGPVPDSWVTAEGEMRCDEESRQYPVFNRGRVIGIVTVARVIDPRFDGGDLAGTPLGPFDSGWCIAEAGLPVCTAMVDELSGFHRYVVAATGETRGIGAEYGGARATSLGRPPKGWNPRSRWCASSPKPSSPTLRRAFPSPCRAETRPVHPADRLVRALAGVRAG